MMTKQERRQVSRTVRKWADQIEDGNVEWVHITLQYNDGRITYATKGAPKRPKGLS